MYQNFFLFFCKPFVVTAYDVFTYDLIDFDARSMFKKVKFICEVKETYRLKIIDTHF